MKIIKFFKTLRRIVWNYDKDYKCLTEMIQRVHDIAKNSEQVIRDRTDVHADIHYKSPHNIILVGRYRNKDYVQCYNIESTDFTYFVKILRNMEHSHIARIDSPTTVQSNF